MRKSGTFGKTSWSTTSRTKPEPAEGCNRRIGCAESAIYSAHRLHQLATSPALVASQSHTTNSEPMSNNEIVQKLWNLCDVLRDDGINYSDYVTELVLLLFIKMEYENTQSGVMLGHKLPEGTRWPDIAKKSGINLLNDYRRILFTLSTGKRLEADPQNPEKSIEVTVVTDPLILAIYADAQTRLKEPRHLEQLIKAIDGIDWFSAQRDGLGDLYEGLDRKSVV